MKGDAYALLAKETKVKAEGKAESTAGHKTKRGVNERDRKLGICCAHQSRLNKLFGIYFHLSDASDATFICCCPSPSTPSSDTEEWLGRPTPKAAPPLDNEN